MANISKEILDILACPKCKGQVHLEDDGLVCDSCRLVYPVNKGIPIMLADEAKALNDAENG